MVGGGGLFLLRALLLGLPHVPAAQILGTNKAVAIVGTTGAAVTYVRKAPVQVWTAVRIGLAALAGSMGGAFFAAGISSDVLRPVIMVVLLAVAAFVMLRPSFGAKAEGEERAPLTQARIVTAIVVVGGGIGFYDGLFGPGTGHLPGPRADRRAPPGPGDGLRHREDRQRLHRRPAHAAPLPRHAGARRPGEPRCCANRSPASGSSAPSSVTGTSGNGSPPPTANSSPSASGPAGSRPSIPRS
ncbi:hypothetical protein STANM309S_02096 [Streptomyces tanashiensis]